MRNAGFFLEKYTMRTDGKTCLSDPKLDGIIGTRRVEVNCNTNFRDAKTPEQEKLCRCFQKTHTKCDRTFG